MLKEYLIVAQEALNAKKEIYQIKQQRFELAQEEYQQLHKMCEDDNRSYASCEFTFSFSWFIMNTYHNTWGKKVFSLPYSPLIEGSEDRSEAQPFISAIQGLWFPVRSAGV